MSHSFGCRREAGAIASQPPGWSTRESFLDSRDPRCSDPFAKERAGAVALGLFGGKTLDGAAAAVDRATRGAIRKLIRRKDFPGRFLECAVLYPPGLRAPRLILVGLGPPAGFHAGRALQAAA